MDTNTLIVVAIVVVLLILVAVGLAARKRKSAKLRDRFGPEYERTLEESGDKRKTEAELKDRAKRVAKFEIRPLAPGDHDKYVRAWRQIQTDFVDNPKVAVMGADDLLAEIMGVRGYPMGDFEQRSADLSVDHPVVVQNYRAAREIAVRHARGDAGTEDLRQAMIHYRTLFDELVGEPAPAQRAKAS
ncbi:MAG: hypothetical protein V4759_10760 [Pseudomonadota bacterium]